MLICILRHYKATWFVYFPPNSGRPICSLHSKKSRLGEQCNIEGAGDQHFYERAWLAVSRQ